MWSVQASRTMHLRRGVELALLCLWYEVGLSLPSEGASSPMGLGWGRSPAAIPRKTLACFSALSVLTPFDLIVQEKGLDLQLNTRREQQEIVAPQRHRN